MKKSTKWILAGYILLVMFILWSSGAHCQELPGRKNKAIYEPVKWESTIENCNETQILYLLTGAVGCTYFLTPSAKLTAWQNTRPYGADLSAGYQSAIYKKVGDKRDSNAYYNTLFTEGGYHVRVFPRWIIHEYVGFNKGGQYFGSATMFAMSYNVTMNAEYRQQHFEISFTFRILN